MCTISTLHDLLLVLTDRVMTHSLCFFVFGFVVVSSISDCFTCKLALLDLANTSFLRMEFRLKREWKHSVGSSGHSVCQGIKAECFSDLQQLNFIWLLQRPSFPWADKLKLLKEKGRSKKLRTSSCSKLCTLAIIESQTHTSQGRLFIDLQEFERGQFSSVLRCPSIFDNFCNSWTSQHEQPWIYVCIYVHVAQYSCVS